MLFWLSLGQGLDAQINALAGQTRRARRGGGCIPPELCDRRISKTATASYPKTVIIWPRSEHPAWGSPKMNFGNFSQKLKEFFGDKTNVSGDVHMDVHSRSQRRSALPLTLRSGSSRNTTQYKPPEIRHRSRRMSGKSRPS